MPALFHRSLQRPLSFVLLLIPLTLTVLSCGLLILVVAVGPEGYFFPYPAIDTRFAPGYSEQAFQQIQIGMTKEEVLQRLGPPLNNVGDFVWIYAEDNAFAVWDFAWLMREIAFDEHGRVKAKRAEVAYD